MTYTIETLPNDIQWHIMKFTRHPVAEIIRQSHQYKYIHYSEIRVRGDPFDRGQADAYYWRDECPHKIIERVKDSRGRYYDVRAEIHDLIPEEIEAFVIGYHYQEDRK